LPICQEKYLLKTVFFLLFLIQVLLRNFLTGQRWVFHTFLLYKGCPCKVHLAQSVRLIHPTVYGLPAASEARASDTGAFPSGTDWVKWTISRYFLYFFPTLRVKMPYNMGKTGYI